MSAWLIHDGWERAPKPIPVSRELEGVPIDVRSTGRLRAVLIIASAALAAVWVLRRAHALLGWLDGDDDPFAIVLAGACLMFIWQIGLAWLERPHAALLYSERRYLAHLKVCVNLPCYNEDPLMLSRSLASIFAQTRLPDEVQIVDDGSTADYGRVFAYWQTRVPVGVEFSHVRTENQGKRHAQMETFANSDADIFVTMDSDTVLHRQAIEEGLKPFADPKVTSVAGLVLGLNKHTNLLTMIEDLVFTSWQLTMRSAYSLLGSVIVNCGPFALYRAELVRAGADGYLHETLAGRTVTFSDDSLLTLYAATHGRTVQQPTAIALSAWPETFSHHLRQQIRWTRGSFIRSLWRGRYLPLSRPAYWLTLAGWTQFVATTAMFVYIGSFQRHLFLSHLPEAAGLMCLLSYATTMRSLTLRRSDETLAQQLFVFACSPLVLAWALFVYRPLRIWGMLTFRHMGWGTRTQVELGGTAVHAKTGRPLKLVFAGAALAATTAVALNSSAIHGTGPAAAGIPARALQVQAVSYRRPPTLTASSSRLLGVMTDPWHLADYSQAYGTNLRVTENFMPFGAQADPSNRLAEAARLGQTPLITWMPRAAAAEADPHAYQPAFSNTAIAAGRQDAYISRFARELARFPGTVILRYAPEMNGRWEPWHVDPRAYVKAWRHIWTIFQREGADNVRFAWTPAHAQGLHSFAAWRRKVNAYYPGSRYVDYVGTTTVSHHFESVTYFAHRLAPLSYWHKPLVLAEVYAPLETRARWVKQFAALINRMPNVKIVVWCDLSVHQPLSGAAAHSFASIRH